MAYMVTLKLVGGESIEILCSRESAGDVMASAMRNCRLGWKQWVELSCGEVDATRRDRPQRD